MIAFERLAALALGELSPADASDVEAHVIECDACARRLEQLLELGDAVAEVTRAGHGGVLAGAGLVARLAGAALVTRRYQLAPNGETACGVDAGDVYSSLRLELQTRGIDRLDIHASGVGMDVRIADVPFDADGVTYVLTGDYLRTLPSGRRTIRLLAVDDAGERVVAEYFLAHTGYAGR